MKDQDLTLLRGFEAEHICLDVYKRQIHKNLRTLSGLTVLIGYIMNGIVMTDITEMDIYRLFNIDQMCIRDRP